MTSRVLLCLCLLLGCGASVEAPPEPGSEPAAETSPPGQDPPTGEEAVETPPDDGWEPPPYEHEPLQPAEHAEVCAHTAHPPSEHECDEDTDCRICHDGSRCGGPVNLEELRRRGAACEREDAAECEPAAVRCCDGRCRVGSH